MPLHINAIIHTTMKSIFNYTATIVAFILSFQVNAQQSSAEDWKNEIRKVYQLVDQGVFLPSQGERMLKDIKTAARVDLENQLLMGNPGEEKQYVVLFWGKPADASKPALTIRDTVPAGKVDEQLAFYFDDLEAGYVKYGVIYRSMRDTQGHEDKHEYTTLSDIDLPVFDDLHYVNVSVKGKIKRRSHQIAVNRLTNAEGIQRISDSLKIVIAAELERNQSEVMFSEDIDTQFTVFGGDIPSSMMNDKRLFSVGIHIFGEGHKGWAIRKNVSFTKGGVYAITLGEADSVMRAQIKQVIKRFNDNDVKPKYSNISGVVHVKDALIEPAGDSNLENLFRVAPPLLAFEYPSRRLKSREDLQELYTEEGMADQIYEDYRNDVSNQLEKALSQLDESLEQLDVTIDQIDKSMEYYSVFSVEKREKSSPASVYFLMGTGFSSLSENNQYFAENDQWTFSPTLHIGLRGELMMSKRWYLSSEFRYSVHRHRFRRNNYFTDVDGVTDFIRSEHSLNRSSLASSYYDLQLGIGVKTGWRVFSEIEIGIYGGAHSRSTSRTRYNDEEGYTIRDFQRGSFNVNPYRHGAYLSFGDAEGIQNRVMYDLNPYFTEWNGARLHIVSYALMVYF